MTQKELDKLLKDNHVTPMGRGYIDCICPIENAASFIHALSAAGINTTEFTWWCCAGGGRASRAVIGHTDKYGAGAYKGLSMGDTYMFSSTKEMEEFFSNERRKMGENKISYLPGFWLQVPNEWENNAV